jgi:S-adenosylmethionine:tRNA ribosyltransferase-isomerase
MHPKNISILDYTYNLPDEKIALHPLAERDSSKLLLYKNGTIQGDTYKNIAAHLPQNSLLVFNNTKVINARVLFTKETGGTIEIFLLEPYKADYAKTLSATKTCNWKCFIGGAAKWKGGSLQLTINGKKLLATLIETLPDAYGGIYLERQHIFC